MELSRNEAIDLLNRIVELELAGAVRYTQYSLMVFGHARIPIMGWMRDQAAESLTHATQAGEEVTTLGAQVSLGIGELAGTYHESVDDIMQGAAGARAQRHRPLSAPAGSQRRP